MDFEAVDTAKQPRLLTGGFKKVCTKSVIGEVGSMSTLVEIEAAIERLPKSDFRQLREWIAERDQQLWDKQMEADIAAGRLDRFAQEAIADFQAGRFKDL